MQLLRYPLARVFGFTNLLWVSGLLNGVRRAAGAALAGVMGGQSVPLEKCLPFF